MVGDLRRAKRSFGVNKSKEEPSTSDSTETITLSREERDDRLCSFFDQLEPRQQMELVKLLHRMEEPIPEKILKAKIRIPKDGKESLPISLPLELMANPKNSSKTTSSNKRHQPTYETKRRIIELREQGYSVEQLMRDFELPKSTIYNILSSREAILKRVANGLPESKKRTKVSDAAFEEALLDWMREQHANDQPIDGLSIRKQALEIARELGNTEFKGSSGWLASFKNRHAHIFNGTKPLSSDAVQGLEEHTGSFNWFTGLLDSILKTKPPAISTNPPMKKPRKDSSIDDAPPPLSPMSSNSASSPPRLDTEDGNPAALEQCGASTSKANDSNVRSISGFTFRKVKLPPNSSRNILENTAQPKNSNTPLLSNKTNSLAGPAAMNKKPLTQNAEVNKRVIKEKSPENATEIGATATAQIDIKEEPLDFEEIMSRINSSEGQIPGQLDDDSIAPNLRKLFEQNISESNHVCKECLSCKLPLPFEEYMDHLKEIETLGRCSLFRRCEGNFPCAYEACEKTFESMTNYVNHLRVIHGKPAVVQERTFFGETEYLEFINVLRTLGDFPMEAIQKFSMKQHRCAYSHDADDSDVEYDDCEVPHKGRIPCSAFFHSTIESSLNHEKVIHLRYCDFHIHGRMRLPKVVRKRIRFLGRYLPDTVLLIIIKTEANKYAGMGGLLTELKKIDLHTINQILITGGIIPIGIDSNFETPSERFLSELSLPEALPLHYVQKACDQWIASQKTEISQKIRQRLDFTQTAIPRMNLTVPPVESKEPRTLADALNFFSDKHPVLQSQETRRRQKITNIINSIRIMAVKLTAEKLLSLSESELVQFEMLVRKCMDVSEQKELSKSNDPSRPFPCGICSTGYYHKGGLRLHLQREHNLESKEIKRLLASFEPQYTCLLCDNIFPEYKAIREHQVRIHGKFDVDTTTGMVQRISKISSLVRIPDPMDSDFDGEDVMDLIESTVSGEGLPRSPTQLISTDDVKPQMKDTDST